LARVVLGLGTSHSPQVSTGPEVWELHADRDRANPSIPFGELAALRGDELIPALTREVWETKHLACQTAVDRLSEILYDAAPDFIIVVGDDQHELFLDDNIPAIAVYWGDELWDLPEDKSRLAPSLRPAAWARHADEPERYPTVSEFGRYLVETLCTEGFDVSQFSVQPAGRSVGHAFTFVRRRLMREDKVIPMVPLMINTIYPPNQPTPVRCVALGRALRAAIDAWPSEIRVGLVASGGLSHFVVNEALDRTVLQAIEEHDDETLASLPVDQLTSGSSEIRNWITVSAAMMGTPVEFLEYVPGYRSEAGTGCGMAFAAWRG
jgi:3-O-methylgallate 3,4-dioxygenase